jgi:FkbM family methyltransferase
LPDLREALAAAAAGDPAWVIAPALALGDRDAVAVLERSAESDMSSLLPRSALLDRISPSSAVIERLEVPLRRLDRLELVIGSSWRRMLLKLDVQGSEASVLDGASGLWERIAAVQLELSLVPLYHGETPWRAMVDRLADRGFALGLVIPGYYERKLGRQLQFDGVFWRETR